MTEDKLLLVMVGLPARGKTYLARKLARYLAWRGHGTRVFNVGSYRRRRLGGTQRHDFFSPGNERARASRLELAMAALDDALEWLDAGGRVAIYDATNTTRRRRQLVLDRCAERGVATCFVETICDDPEVIEQNIRETKLHGPDYVGMAPEEAVADFKARIAHYQEVYEPITDDQLAYIKLVDMGRQVVLNRIAGELPRRVAVFLMHVGWRPDAVWLTRHGRSEYNRLGLLGGDPDLCEEGRAYAERLARHVIVHEDRGRPLVVWTSTLRRTLQTASPLGRPATALRALDEINAGVCEAMTYEAIAAQMPEEFEARRRDKFGYRYPRGESYRDLVERVDEVVLALEQARGPVLVIAHQAVLRVLYAYLQGSPIEQCPHLDIPLHTVIALKPGLYDLAEERVEP